MEMIKNIFRSAQTQQNPNPPTFHTQGSWPPQNNRPNYNQRNQNYNRNPNNNAQATQNMFQPRRTPNFRQQQNYNNDQINMMPQNMGGDVDFTMNDGYNQQIPQNIMNGYAPMQNNFRANDNNSYQPFNEEINKYDKIKTNLRNFANKNKLQFNTYLPSRGEMGVNNNNQFPGYPYPEQQPNDFYRKKKFPQKIMETDKMNYPFYPNEKGNIPNPNIPNIVNKNEFYSGKPNINKNKFDNQKIKRRNEISFPQDEIINEEDENDNPSYQPSSFQRNLKKNKKIEKNEQFHPPEKGKPSKKFNSPEIAPKNKPLSIKPKKTISFSPKKAEKEEKKEVYQKTKIDPLALIEFKKKHAIDNPIPNNESNTKEKALLTKMCSKEEIKEREEQNLLSIFELDPELSYFNKETSMWVKKAKPEYAIKAFQRSGGDLNKIDPSNIRTPLALKKTINYIINEIVDCDTNPKRKFVEITPITFSEVCLFVIDRFKAIRKDFTIIEDIGKECIESNEFMARFLILCLNETLDLKTISGEQGLYNLNMTQLNSTLTSLFEFYEKNSKIKDSYKSTNQEEFISYFLLLALKQKPIEFISILSRIKKEKRNSPKIYFVLKIAKAILSKDWRTFMKLLKSSDCNYLTGCMMVIFFNEIRFAAINELCTYSKAKDSHYLVSINQLCNILPFENSDECFKFLNWFGIEYPENVEEDHDAKFALYKNSEYANENYNFLNAPMKTNYTYVESKKGNKSRKEVMLGGQILEESNDYLGLEVKKENVIFKFPLQKEEKKEDKPQLKLFTMNKEDNCSKKEKNDSSFFGEPSQPSEKEKTKSFTFKSSFFQEKAEEDNGMNSSLIKPNISCLESSSIIMTGDEVKNLFTQKKSDEQNESSISLSDAYPEEKISFFISIMTIIEKNFDIQLKAEFFMILQLIKEKAKIKEKIREHFIKRTKGLILAELKKNVLNSRYNKQYMKEMIRYNMNISSLDARENYFLQGANGNNHSTLNLSLYTYEDLKFFLFDNFMKTHPEEINENCINYIQVNFYTTRDILVNSNIIQNLHVHESITHVGKTEVLIYEPDIRLEKGKFSLFIRFILIDKIKELDTFIFENQNNLKKFTYGIICFDLADNDVINKLITLLEITFGSVIKKKFIFFFIYKNSISDSELASLHKTYLKLYSQFEIEQNDENKIFYIGNVQNFSEYYHKMLIYNNNKTFVELFKTNFKFETFDKSKKMLSLKEYHKSLKLNNYINELNKDYSYKNYNGRIQQILLGICLNKIMSNFYYEVFSKYANSLFNIPTFISDNKIFNTENLCLKMCDLFKSFANISLFELYRDCDTDDVLLFFDYYIHEIIQILLMNEEQIIIMKDKINSIEYESKKYCFYNMEPSSVNLIYLPIFWYSKLIELISDYFSVQMNISYSLDIFKKVFSRYEVLVIEELNDFIEDLIDNSNPYTGHNKIILKCIHNNQTYENSKNFESNNNYLNMKRKREFSPDSIQNEKQLSLQYISRPKESIKDAFFALEENGGNDNRRLDLFPRNIIQYKYL